MVQLRIIIKKKNKQLWKLFRCYMLLDSSTLVVSSRAPPTRACRAARRPIRSLHQRANRRRASQQPIRLLRQIAISLAVVLASWVVSPVSPRSACSDWRWHLWRRSHHDPITSRMSTASVNKWALVAPLAPVAPTIVKVRLIHLMFELSPFM